MTFDVASVGANVLMVMVDSMPVSISMKFNFKNSSHHFGSKYTDLAGLLRYNLNIPLKKI